MYDVICKTTKAGRKGAKNERHAARYRNTEMARV